MADFHRTTPSATQPTIPSKRSRGDGRIFLRGSTYWCAFYVRGKGEQRESCKTADLKQAEKYLRARIKQVHRSELDLTKPFLTAAAHKRTVADLMTALRTDFELRGKLNAQSKSLIGRVTKDFANIHATALTAQQIAGYVRDLLAEGYKNASVNRFTTVLRQAFKLADLPCPKVVKLYEGDNVRTGFFENSQIRRVMANMQDHGKPVPDLVDFVLFAWLTGMRKGEIKSLCWADLEGDVLTLRAENAKNRHSRVIPLEGELLEVIERRRAARKGSDLIFHRDTGKIRPIGNFAKVWNKACRLAGVPPETRLFHDMRRSAVRDLIRSGVSESVAMSISGHRTRSMFSRYNITTTTDQRRALQAVQEYRLATKEQEQPQQVLSTAVN